jgi:hypothetical protein
MADIPLLWVPELSLWLNHSNPPLPNNQHLHSEARLNPYMPFKKVVSTNWTDLNWTELKVNRTEVQPKVKVRVILQLTVSQPVYPGVSPPSGTRDQFFFYFLGNCLDICKVFNMVHALCPEGGSAIDGCCWASPAHVPSSNSFWLITSHWGLSENTSEFSCVVTRCLVMDMYTSICSEMWLYFRQPRASHYRVSCLSHDFMVDRVVDPVVSFLQVLWCIPCQLLFHPWSILWRHLSIMPVI